MNPSYKKPALNLFSLTAMRGISAVLAMVLFITLARSWGSERVGEFSLLLSFYILLQAMPLLGLSTLVQRVLSQNPELITRYRPALHIIALCAGVLISAGLVIMARLFYPAHLLPSFCIMGCAILVGAPAVVDESITMAQEKMWVTAAISAGESTIRTVGALIGIGLGHGVVWVSFCFAAARLCATVAYQIALPRKRQPFEMNLIASLIRQCPTFLAIVFAGTALMRFDTIALSLTHDLSAVGTYSTAYRMFELFLSVVIVAVIAIFPTVAREFDRTDAMRLRFIQAFRITLGIGIPIAGTIISFAPLLIKTAYGGKFNESVPVFNILIVMLLLYAIDRIFSMLVHSAKRPDLDRNALLVGVGVLIVLLALTVPRFGGYGAAASVAGAWLCVLIVRLTDVRTHLGWDGFIRSSRYILIAAGAMIGTWSAVSRILPDPVGFLSGMGVYMAILVVTGQISRQRVSAILSVRPRHTIQPENGEKR